MTGTEIEKLRKKLGLSQGKLAEKLGVTRMTIYNWENKKKRPSNLAIRELTRLNQNAKKESNNE